MYRFNRASSACVLAATALVAGMFMFVSGCKSGGDQTTDTTKSLYDRLGGEPAITDVVDKFVAYAAPDPAVNFTRKGLPTEWNASPENVAKLKKHLVQFICHATGGPQTYEGRDMVAVHTGMKITEAEWNASVVDLKKALTDDKVSSDLQDELIKIVATTHDSIVGR